MTGPLEIHICLPPATLQEGCSTVDSETLGIVTDALFIMVSHSLALTKGHSNILPLWVLFQSYKCHKYWYYSDHRRCFSDHNPSQVGSCLSGNFYISTHSSVLLPLLSETQKKTLKQRLFPAGTVIVLEEMQNVKLLAHKWAPTSLGACSISEQFDCQVKNCSPITWKIRS